MCKPPEKRSNSQPTVESWDIIQDGADGEAGRMELEDLADELDPERGGLMDFFLALQHPNIRHGRPGGNHMQRFISDIYQQYGGAHGHDDLDDSDQDSREYHSFTDYGDEEDQAMNTQDDIEYEDDDEDEEMVEEDGELTEYTVETILNHKIVEERPGDQVYYYLIKWAGYDECYNTWEPEYNIFCHQILEDYHARVDLSPDAAATSS